MDRILRWKMGYFSRVFAEMFLRGEILFNPENPGVNGHGVSGTGFDGKN
jgi:hypothetical protein